MCPWWMTNQMGGESNKVSAPRTSSSVTRPRTSMRTKISRCELKKEQGNAARQP